jgi:hypothetical protein
MANPKKLLASAAIAAGLLGGGVVGVVLGVPGVSGAQTTTVPDTPGTTVPGTDRPAHDGNCPNMGGGSGNGTTPGQAPAAGTGTNLGFRRGGGGTGRV